MKAHILIFALAFVLWAWLNLHARREKKKKRMQKETKKILIERLKSKAKSVVRNERISAIMENIGDSP